MKTHWKCIKIIKSEIAALKAMKCSILDPLILLKFVNVVVVIYNVFNSYTQESFFSSKLSSFTWSSASVCS